MSFSLREYLLFFAVNAFAWHEKYYVIKMILMIKSLHSNRYRILYSFYKSPLALIAYYVVYKQQSYHNENDKYFFCCKYDCFLRPTIKSIAVYNMIVQKK